MTTLGVLRCMEHDKPLVYDAGAMAWKCPDNHTCHIVPINVLLKEVLGVLESAQRRGSIASS